MAGPNISLIAEVIVTEHGEGAGFFAVQHADEQLARGDLVGAAIWMRLLQAIDGLQQKKANPAATSR